MALVPALVPAFALVFGLALGLLKSWALYLCERMWMPGDG